MLKNNDRIKDDEELYKLINDLPNIFWFTVAMLLMLISLGIMFFTEDEPINLITMGLFITAVIIHIINFIHYKFKKHEKIN